METKTIKLMIIENFIDWYAGDEAERDYLKQGAENYIKEDHVDEIAQAFANPAKEIEQHNDFMMGL